MSSNFKNLHQTDVIDKYLNIVNNSVYRKMFCEADVSDAEKKILAAVIGKTIDECRYEWSKAFKLSQIFDLTKHNLVLEVQETDDRINIVISMSYLDDTTLTGLKSCDGINSIEGIIDNSLNIPPLLSNYPRWFKLFMSFSNDELSVDDLVEIKRAIINRVSFTVKAD